LIIWLNGTFGSGKTTTAYELQKRVPNSFVYDPERFGYVLMANIPKEMSKEDFQDYTIWRESNYALLKQVAEGYKGIIIVPMTLTNELYFEDIIGRLKADGIEVKHYTLAASPQTVQKRLRKRLEGKNSWAYQQIDKRLELLANNAFKEHIQTDRKTIEEVVETIAHRSGITLLPDHRSNLAKISDRLSVKMKEIRLFK
jgi:cytidylate kinase